MTLVLPYCNNQVKNLSFEPISSKMPCVFDGEPLDFESALMVNDWPPLKDIAADYGGPANDDTSSAKATPGSTEKPACKRKLPVPCSDSCEGTGPTESKRACTEKPTACPLADSPASPSSTSSSSSSVDGSSNCQSDGHEESSSSGVTDEDEELYQPRRRVLQMWNSRQRWKDERKRVLKMSVNKLSEIEDPELWLLRSVLINNTIKRLHQDIRNERQAKMRHRQQKIDFYNEKYEPAVHQRLQSPGYDQSSSTFDNERKKSRVDSCSANPTTPPSDSYDDTSCDEIFGISEDFLRVTIPDRRVSSPIPTNPVQEHVETAKNCGKESSNSLMEVDSVSSSCSYVSKQGPDCDVRSSAANLSSRDCAVPAYSGGGLASNSRTQQSGLNSSCQQRHLSGGSQCATQYRTSNSADSDCIGGDSVGVFPPRVPILDSVVYHSLLASLESS